MVLTGSGLFSSVIINYYDFTADYDEELNDCGLITSMMKIFVFTMILTNDNTMKYQDWFGGFRQPYERLKDGGGEAAYRPGETIWIHDMTYLTYGIKGIWARLEYMAIRIHGIYGIFISVQLSVY